MCVSVSEENTSSGLSARNSIYRKERGGGSRNIKGKLLIK
jgi:hypothetical protein